MQRLKPLGDGIGTAAGVAWPTFGLIFGALGLTISGLAATILGAISIGIFILVFAPITYWSYKNYIDDKAQLKQKIGQLENNYVELAFKYLSTLMDEYLFAHRITSLKHNDIDKAVQFIHEKIQHDINSKKISPNHPCVQLWKNYCHQHDNNQFLNKFANLYYIDDDGYDEYKQLCKLNIVLRDIMAIRDKNNSVLHQTIPLSIGNHIKMGAMGFFSAFGSIAGCSAGVAGLLLGLGVFTGLSSIPIVGWAAIAGALVFGFAVAAVCIYSAREKNKDEQYAQYVEKTNHAMQEIIQYKHTKLKVHMKYDKKHSSDHFHRKKVVDTSTDRNDHEPSTSLKYKYIRQHHPIWRHLDSSASQQRPNIETKQQARHLSNYKRA